MMSLRIRVGNVEVAFHFWFFVVVLLFTLLGKESLAMYIALPILIHEAGHILVLLLCKVKIRGITFTPVSVDIIRHTGTVDLRREICIGMGGIAANLLTAATLYFFCFQSMRVMFLITANLAVAFFNLLPIGNLDGGEIVRQVCQHFFFPHAARNISQIVSMLILAPLFGVSIWLIWSRNGNFTLLLTCIYLVVAVICRE